MRICLNLIVPQMWKLENALMVFQSKWHLQTANNKRQHLMNAIITSALRICVRKCVMCERERERERVGLCEIRTWINWCQTEKLMNALVCRSMLTACIYRSRTDEFVCPREYRFNKNTHSHSPKHSPYIRFNGTMISFQMPAAICLHRHWQFVCPFVGIVWTLNWNRVPNRRIMRVTFHSETSA